MILFSCHRYHSMLAAFVMVTGALLCWPVQAASPVGRTAVTIGQRFVLHSEVLGESRELLVHLPKGYAKSHQRYAVLFLLDGNTHFNYASGLIDFLADNGRAPPHILVAVPAMQRRGRDMTMPPILSSAEDMDKALGPHARMGGGAEFLRFLADELAPWVDENYRTQPFRILSGHSLGGLFNFYALMERPDTFQAHIAPSPSLWYDNEAWVLQAKERIGDLPGKHWLYFTWGDHESSIADPGKKLVNWMDQQAFSGLEWTWRYYPGDDHGTTPLRTFYDGLQWLYKDWRSLSERDLGLDRTDVENSMKLLGDMAYSDLDRRISEHYEDLSRRYGYAIEPDAEAKRWRRNWFRANEKYDEALAQARSALVEHPEQSAKLYREISRMLDKQGRPVEALAEYQNALNEDEISPESVNEHASEFETRFRLEELMRKAAEKIEKKGNG